MQLSALLVVLAAASSSVGYQMPGADSYPAMAARDAGALGARGILKDASALEGEQRANGGIEKRTIRSFFGGKQCYKDYEKAQSKCAALGGMRKYKRKHCCVLKASGKPHEWRKGEDEMGGGGGDGYGGGGRGQRNPDDGANEDDDGYGGAPSHHSGGGGGEDEDPDF